MAFSCTQVMPLTDGGISTKSGSGFCANPRGAARAAPVNEASRIHSLRLIFMRGARDSRMSLLLLHSRLLGLRVGRQLLHDVALSFAVSRTFQSIVNQRQGNVRFGKLGRGFDQGFEGLAGCVEFALLD